MFEIEVAPGVEIRHLEMADAEALFQVTDRNRTYLRQWLPWVDRTHSAGDTRDYIAARIEQYESNGGPTAAIWRDGAIIGAVGCHPIDWMNRNCSVGYWLDAAHQGKGFMTSAVTALIDYLFTELAVHRVVIQCGTGNHRSCAIPKRLGFTREGVLRDGEWVNDRWVDLIVWSILAHEWKGNGSK